MLRVLPSIILFVSVLLISGCGSEEPERPDSVGIGGPVGVIGSGSGDGGEEGGGTDGAATGQVVQFVDDSFSGVTAYVGLSVVSIASTDGRSAVDGEYDGAEFVVEGNVVGRRWVQASPIDDATRYPTITQQDFGEDASSVPVVQRVVLDQVFQGLTSPAEMVATRAQLVVRIVDGSGVGIAAVKANIFASNPNIAYSDDGLWQSFGDATTSDGLILVSNLEASPFPGQAIQVLLTGAVEAEREARIAGGAITVLTVVVP
jgi:hypothetical protein